MPLMEPLRLSTRRSNTNNLNPEDEQSLLGSVAQTGLGVFAKAGNALDLLPSVVRDALTWLPGGRRANPFDQFLSPLSGENRTSGRDLLTDYGITAPNKEAGIAGWKDDPMEAARDIGGFAVDVLTDPLTYLSFGASALGKGGQAAKNAGLLDDLTRVAARKANVPLNAIGPRQARLTTTVGDLVAHGGPDAMSRLTTAADAMRLDPIDLLNETVGGMARAKVPFMDPISLMGTGPTAQKTAAFLDKWSPNPFEFGSVFKQSVPGQVLGSVLDATRLGKMTPEVTPYAQQVFKKTTEGLQHGKAFSTEHAQKLKEAGLIGSKDAETLRSAIEGVPYAFDTSGVAATTKKAFEDSRQASIAAGLKQTDELDDVVEYAFRQNANAVSQGKGQSPLMAKLSSDQGRQGTLKGFKQGTVGGPNSLESVFTNPTTDAEILRMEAAVKANPQRWSDPVKAQNEIVRVAAKRIADRHNATGDILPTFRAQDADGNFLFEGGKRLTPGAVNSKGEWNAAGNWERLDNDGNVLETLIPKMKDRFKEIARLMVEHPEVRKSGMFTNHPIVDTGQYLGAKKVQQDTADVATDFLRDYARPKDPSVPGVKLGEMFQQLGLDADAAARILATKRGLQIPTDPAAATKFLRGIRKLEVDSRIADDYLRPLADTTASPAWEKIGQAVDNFTNLFKASVLSWPATKVRDLLSGAGRNMEQGVFDSGSWVGSDRVYRGHDIARAAEIPILKQLVAQQGLPLNDATATRAYKLLFAKLGPGRLNEQADVAGAAVGSAAPNYAGKLDDLLGLIPGGKPTTHLQDVGEFGKTFAGLTPDTNPLRFNPLTKDFWAQFTKLRGVDGNTETRFGPVTAMENLGSRTDFMNRSVPFLNMLKKGIDPDEAMRRINDMQVDYDPRTFTPSERTLKRLFPFYAYTSRQLGYVGRELTQNPGGPMGQTIRAINAGRSNDALLPEHIADTATIPLPARVNDGTKRYLTGLNMMFEDPLSLIGGPQSAGLEVLSRLNPLVKGPLEFITGRSLFQKGPRGGRPLDDLDPTLGRISTGSSNRCAARSRTLSGLT